MVMTAGRPTTMRDGIVTPKGRNSTWEVRCRRHRARSSSRCQLRAAEADQDAPALLTALLPWSRRHHR
jgi:hypothetical protein